MLTGLGLMLTLSDVTIMDRVLGQKCLVARCKCCARKLGEDGFPLGCAQSSLNTLTAPGRRVREIRRDAAYGIFFASCDGIANLVLCMNALAQEVVRPDEGHEGAGRVVG